MAQTFRDLSIVEPGHNPLTGDELVDITTAGCCEGVGDRVFQLEKPTNTELQFLAPEELPTGDFVVKFRAFPSSDDDSIAFIFWRADEHNFYELRLGHNTLHTASVHRVVNGVSSVVVADTTVTALAGKPAFIRIKLTSGQIEAKVWLATSSEPNTWSITHTVPATTATGFGFSQVSARFVDWHWLASSDVVTEPAYKASIPSNDTTQYPGGNLTVSGAAYYHEADIDGLGLPAIGAIARVYDQKTGILISRNNRTDASARYTISNLKTVENCYATFSPIDPASQNQTGIANLLMPARLASPSAHNVPSGAPTVVPATYFVIHLPSDADNLVRIANTDGTNLSTAQLFGLGDKLTGYQGFDSSGAVNLGTWTVTSVVTSTASRYQLFYVDRSLPIARIAGTATYDDRVLYGSRTVAPSATRSLSTNQESEVRGIVTKQAGTLLDNLVECFLTLGVERDSVAPTTFNFNNTNATTLATADTLKSGTCTAVLVSGYDPLILDDNRILLLAPATAGSPLAPTRRVTFTLTNNGVPSAIDINIGHTTSGQLLVSRSATTANTSLTIIVANLLGVGSIEHLKRAIEAATGAREINQQAFSGVAHTVFYTGAGATPPDAFEAGVKAGSICIKDSTHEIFYRRQAAPVAITRRDEVRFTTGSDGYRIGAGTADRMPDDLIGFFYRGVLRSQSDFTIGLREDTLPSGFSATLGSTFQARWSTGASTPTGAWTTFTRTRSTQQLSGHTYLYYGSPLVSSSTALTANQSYTMQFRSTASGNPAINVWAATTNPLGSWQRLVGGSPQQGTGFTQEQIEEFSRDAVAQALETGDNAVDADIQFVHDDAANTIKAQIKAGSIQSGDIKRDSSDSTIADDLQTWQTVFGISGVTIPDNRKIPAGGSRGQILGKVSATDFATGWIDRLSESDRNKIDEAYDLVRDFDDIFTITPGYNLPDIGWANYKTAGSQRTFGSISPSAPNPPTFMAGGNRYRFMAVFHQRDQVQKTLSIMIGGENNAVETVPPLPPQVEFIVGGVTYRSRDHRIDSIDRSAGGDDALIRYFITLGQTGIFTAGTLSQVQVLLTGDGDRLLPPITPSDVGKDLRVNVLQKPVWVDRPGVTIEGLELIYRRQNSLDIVRPSDTSGLFKNVIRDGDNLWVFGASATSRLLSKINRFSYPNPVYQTQFTVNPTNTDLAEGFIKGGEFYSLRATTSRTAAKVFQRYLLSNFSTQTTQALSNTTRLGDTITQGWFVTSDADYYWVSEQYGKTNKYRKDTHAYVSAGNIDPGTGTNVTYACSVNDDDHVFLVHDNSSATRQISFVAFSKVNGSRVNSADFDVVIDNQTEWAQFRTYGGAEITNNQLLLVTGVSTRLRIWSQETADNHIGEVAREAVGAALENANTDDRSDLTFDILDTENKFIGKVKGGAGGGGGAVVRSPTVASLIVPANDNALIYTNRLPAGLRNYAQLYDFDIKEQVKFQLPSSVTDEVTLQLYAVDPAGNEISASRPFTILTSATGSSYETVVFDAFARHTANTPRTVPDSYDLRIRNLSDTVSIVLSNVFSIAYPRTEIQYDARAAERNNPIYIQRYGRRNYISDVTGFTLNTSSAPITSSNIEAVAVSPTSRRFISVVDDSGNHRALNYYTYTRIYWDAYNFTIPDAATPAYACWDSTGQYFYYVTGGSTPVLRVFDMGITTSGTPNPTRDTTREFAVNALVTGQNNILGIDSHGGRLWFLVHDGTVFRIVTVTSSGSVSTNQDMSRYLPTDVAAAGLATNGLDVFTTMPLGNRFLEVRELYTDSHVKRDSFPLTFGQGSTTARVKDISIDKYTGSQSYGGRHPLVVAYNPAYGDNIRTYGTRRDISGSESLPTKRFSRLSALDWTARSTPRLWQIIENPTTGKLYCLYGAQSSYWNDDSVLQVETRTSWANPAVEATSARYGNSYGWRSDAPLAQGFLKGNLIYCPERYSANELHTIDLSNNFTLSTSPVVTLTGMTGNDANRDIICCVGNATTFWVQKGTTAYAFNVSDFSRDESKDIRFTRTWSSSRHQNSLVLDSDHLYEFYGSSSGMDLYSHDLNDLAGGSNRVYQPVWQYSGSTYQGIFIPQYRDATDAVADKDEVMFLTSTTAETVIGFVYANVS